MSHQFKSLCHRLKYCKLLFVQPPRTMLTQRYILLQYAVKTKSYCNNVQPIQSLYFSHTFANAQHVCHCQAFSWPDPYQWSIRTYSSYNNGRQYLPMWQWPFDKAVRCQCLRRRHIIVKKLRSCANTSPSIRTMYDMKQGPFAAFIKMIVRLIMDPMVVVLVCKAWRI